jgi:hypothetical protein
MPGMLGNEQVFWGVACCRTAAWCGLVVTICLPFVFIQLLQLTIIVAQVHGSETGPPPGW